MYGETITMGLTETNEYSPGTARKLRQKLNLLFRSKSDATNNNLNTVIETDYLQTISTDLDGTKKQNSLYSSTDTSTSSLSDTSCDQVEDSIDEDMWKSVMSLVREELLEETANRQLELFLPSTLLERISKDIMRMSVSEPYGLRGCSLHLNLQKKSSMEVTQLGVVECDWNTVSTFELHLTLLEDKKRWYSIKDLIAPVLPGCLNESHALEVFISPGFKLVKHKLYRPN